MAEEVPQPVLDYLSSEKTVTLATASADGVLHASTFMYVWQRRPVALLLG